VISTANQYNIEVKYADGSKAELLLDEAGVLHMTSGPNSLVSGQGRDLCSYLEALCRWLGLNGGKSIELKEEVAP